MNYNCETLPGAAMTLYEPSLWYQDKELYRKLYTKKHMHVIIKIIESKIYDVIITITCRYVQHDSSTTSPFPRGLTSWSWSTRKQSVRQMPEQDQVIIAWAMTGVSDRVDGSMSGLTVRWLRFRRIPPLGVSTVYNLGVFAWVITLPSIWVFGVLTQTSASSGMSASNWEPWRVSQSAFYLSFSLLLANLGMANRVWVSWLFEECLTEVFFPWTAQQATVHTREKGLYGTSTATSGFFQQLLLWFGQLFSQVRCFRVVRAAGNMLEPVSFGKVMEILWWILWSVVTPHCFGYAISGEDWFEGRACDGC